MSKSQFSTPAFINADGSRDTLARVPLSGRDSSGQFSERWLQKLVFEMPSILPVADIDAAFLPLVPVCLELNTPAGSVDALFVMPGGRLVLRETKLWRNPQARREVVGQILDYAKKLRRWRYPDL